MDGGGDDRFITVEQAAEFLATAPKTLRNWITKKRFGERDGLRRFGGNTRIHLPTLRARAMAGELMTDDKVRCNFEERLSS